MNLTDVLTGHSKAMHSTWHHYKPDGLLFDCGEGVAIGLSTKIYSVNTVLLGHGHLDHIMGLPGFFFIRSSAKGDNSKPLRVVYPKGDRDIIRLREFIEGSFLPPHHLKFPVTWIEAEPGSVIDLPGDRSVRAFETKHDDTRLSLGYQVLQNRKKLKVELQGIGGDRIRNMVSTGADIFEYDLRNTLTYTGDTRVRDVAEYADADILIHEATFLNREDVKYDSHSLVEDVLAMLVKYKPKNVLLNHFSVRYSPAMCGSAVRSKAKELSLAFPVWVQYGEYCWKAYDPTENESEEVYTTPVKVEPISMTMAPVAAVGGLVATQQPPASVPAGMT